MRRLVATGRPDDLALCVQFVAEVKDTDARRAALDGLAVALNDQVIDAPAGWAEVQKKLLAAKDPAVTELVNKLAVSFRDPAALKRAFDTFQDKTATADRRAEALRQLVRLRHQDAARLVQSCTPRGEGAEGPGRGRPAARRDPDSRPSPRRSSATGRTSPRRSGRSWSTASRPARRGAALLTALAAGTIDRADVTDNVIVRIQAFKDRELNRLDREELGPHPADAEGAGRTHRQDARRNWRPARRRSPAARLVFENQCAKCHKFDGQRGRGRPGAGRGGARRRVHPGERHRPEPGDRGTVLPADRQDARRPSGAGLARRGGRQVDQPEGGEGGTQEVRQGGPGRAGAGGREVDDAGGADGRDVGRRTSATSCAT